jgi:hypothetical protein
MMEEKEIGREFQEQKPAGGPERQQPDAHSPSTWLPPSANPTSTAVSTTVAMKARSSTSKERVRT